MKKSLMVSALLLIAVCVSAQDIVSQNKLNEYIKENIRYTKSAYERGIRGKTVLELQVEADGTISEVSIQKSATYKSLDDEAIRLVRAMPKWLPALKNGQPVSMKTTLPIGFGVK